MYYRVLKPPLSCPPLKTRFFSPTAMKLALQRCYPMFVVFSFSEGQLSDIHSSLYSISFSPTWKAALKHSCIGFLLSHILHKACLNSTIVNYRASFHCFIEQDSPWLMTICVITVQSYDGDEKKWLIARHTIIATSPWSHYQNLDGRQLVCIYDGCSILKSHDHHWWCSGWFLTSKINKGIQIHLITMTEKVVKLIMIHLVTSIAYLSSPNCHYKLYCRLWTLICGQASPELSFWLAWVEQWLAENTLCELSIIWNIFEAGRALGENGGIVLEIICKQER